MISSTNNRTKPRDRKFDFKIVIVGPAKAGKTTMLRYLLDNTDGREMEPTFGYQLEKVRYRGIEFLVYDLGGQPVFVHSFWKQNVETADAVIFVVDATDPESIRASKEYLMYVAIWIKKVPLMILGNKQDLPSSVPKEELLQRLELGELLTSAPVPVTSFQLFDTSAKTGAGVHKAFDWLAQRLGKILPGTSRVSIHKVVVFNTKIGTPVSESREKLEKVPTVLEWSDNNSGTRYLDQSFKNSIDDSTMIFSGIINAIDMMSHFLGAKSLKSITLENDTDKNFILTKEEMDGRACVILCQEGDDLSLVRDLGHRILEWVNEELKTLKSSLEYIGVQKFSEKVEKLVNDLYRVKSGQESSRETKKRRTIREVAEDVSQTLKDINSKQSFG